jgi:hypothetical protein
MCGSNMRSGAQRLRDYRRRQREGRIQVTIELDEVALTSSLIAGRFLAE